MFSSGEAGGGRASMTAEGDIEEPETKRHLSNSVSSVMANSSPQANISVDSAILQYQNQDLFQQLDAHKNERHMLEEKLVALKAKQTWYDDTLITFRMAWNQLVSDLILLGVQAGAGASGLEALDCPGLEGDFVVFHPLEEVFLRRLLDRNVTESGNQYLTAVEDALISRNCSTVSLMRNLIKNLENQKHNLRNMAVCLTQELCPEDALFQLQKICSMLKQDVNNLSLAIEVLQSKHKAYADEIQTCIQRHAVDQAEIGLLAGKLEEAVAELEESRRKLIYLNMQKIGFPGICPPDVVLINGTHSLAKSEVTATDMQKLKNSIQEHEMLATARLSELQTLHEEKHLLLEQLEALKSKLVDDKHVFCSKPYTLLSDYYERLKSEVEKCKESFDTLQAERNSDLEIKEEFVLKVDSDSIVEESSKSAGCKAHDLKVQVNECVAEKNDLEIKLEEAKLDSGKVNIKKEFDMIASALSKEVGMMEKRLSWSKEIAIESRSLHEQACLLRAELSQKTSECKSLTDKYVKQLMEMRSLKKLIEGSKEKQEELRILLDIYGQQCFDNRSLQETRESEGMAKAQVEVLRHALDEHNLELRARAANRMEEACHDRICAAVAEISGLKEKFDASEREIMLLSETIKAKDDEAELYVSEIETVGQAYEDMQSQNQHLLNYLAERDDCNIQLVSGSVKAKHAQSCIHSENQALSKQLQLVISSLDSQKMKIANAEEQIKSFSAEASKNVAANRKLVINIESTDLELVEAEIELNWLKSVVETFENEYEQNQQKMQDIRSEIEHERSMRKKLDDELVELNNQLAEMSTRRREPVIQKLHNEINECKAILRCGVCFDRPKEVVITKCFHLFCNACIQRNLEIRHRKCPGCGTPFGQNDVKQVNI